MKHKLENSKGFTLIELLVVISIIGLLASVILVNLKDLRSKARDAKRKQEIKAIYTALQLYLLENGSFDNMLNTDGVTITQYGQTFKVAYYYSTPTFTTGPGRNSWSVLQAHLSKYLPKLPVDPKNGYTWPSGGYPTSMSLRDGYYFVSLTSPKVSNPINDCGSAGNALVSIWVETALENADDKNTIKNTYPSFYGCVTDGRQYISRLWDYN